MIDQTPGAGHAGGQGLDGVDHRRQGAPPPPTTTTTPPTTTASPGTTTSTTALAAPTVGADAGGRTVSAPVGAAPARKLRRRSWPRDGEDRLGVELHALDRQLAVAQAHDRAVGGLGGDLEHVGQAVAVDDQRVVAGGLERVGQAGEHARRRRGWIERGLAVHQLRRRARPHRRRPGRWPGGRGTRRAPARPAPAKAAMSSRMMPASSGRPGPGESSTASGPSASASSTRRGRRCGGRAARRPARPGTARGCRRSCRSCR